MPIIYRPCPHCRETFSAPTLTMHAPVCPDNPEARERMILCMTDPNRPGVAVGTDAYRTRCSELRAPQLAAVYRRFKTWSAAIEALGLQPPSYTPVLFCPHCGTGFGAIGAQALHIASCVNSPEVRAAIISAMEDPDNPGHALNEAAYRECHKCYDAPTPRTLRARYGAWSDTIQEFGFLPPVKRKESGSTDSGALVEAFDRELALAKAEEVAMREAEEQSRGSLTVCSVRQMADGRVAYMLR